MPQRRQLVVHCHLPRRLHAVYRVHQEKNNPLEKKICILATMAHIWVKLSELVSENSHNLAYKFYWNNWYGSKDMVE